MTSHTSRSAQGRNDTAEITHMRFSTPAQRQTPDPHAPRHDDLVALAEQIEDPLSKMVAITSLDLDRLDAVDRTHMMRLARQLAVEAADLVAELRSLAREAGDPPLTVDLRSEVITTAA